MEDTDKLLRNMFDNLGGAPDGSMTKVAEWGSQYTRRRVREDSFSQALLPFEEVTNDNLAQDEFSEDPSIICEMEADQFAAATIPMNDTTDSDFFWGNKYRLTFYTNSTPVWKKNVNQLRTYRMNLRQQVIDIMLRDLSRRKDFKFMRTANEIVGVVDGGISPRTGKRQNILYPGGLDRNNLVNISRLLPTEANVPNGAFLINSFTFAELLKMNRDQAGGDFSQEMLLKGTGAFKEKTIMDMKFIVTMLNDLVPNGVIYAFTQPRFLGRAATLTPPTMYVEKKKDYISFSCREVIGAAIGNTNGVYKITLQDIATANGGDGRILR